MLRRCATCCGRALPAPWRTCYCRLEYGFVRAVVAGLGGGAGKMQMLARGQPMIGYAPGPERASPLRKLQGNLALARIALFGR